MRLIKVLTASLLLEWRAGSGACMCTLYVGRETQKGERFWEVDSAWLAYSIISEFGCMATAQLKSVVQGFVLRAR